MDVNTIKTLLTALKGAEHKVNLKVEELPDGAHRISISEDLPAGVVGPGALSFTLAYSVKLTGVAETVVEGAEELGLGNLLSSGSTTSST